MRNYNVVAVVLLLAAAVHGQTSLEAKAVARAKRLPVSQLDPKLPKVPLEKFLQAQAGSGAEIKWESNDCGEQTGDPKIDRARDLPICAQADVLLKDGRRIALMVAVGSVRKGMGGAPGLWWLELAVPNGLPESLKHLSDLPVRLRQTAGRAFHPQTRLAPAHNAQDRIMGDL
jgi:hypothetical protein